MKMFSLLHRNRESIKWKAQKSVRVEEKKKKKQKTKSAKCKQATPDQ